MAQMVSSIQSCSASTDIAQQNANHRRDKVLNSLNDLSDTDWEWFCLVGKDREGKYKCISSENQDPEMMDFCKNFQGMGDISTRGRARVIKGVEGSKFRSFSADPIKGNGAPIPTKKKRSRSASGVPNKPKRQKPKVARKAVLLQSETSLDGEDDETDEDGFDGSVQELVEVDVGDRKKLTSFYETQFRLMGQVCLRVIVKAWVKKIQPHKSGSNPYNGGKQKKESVAKFGEHMDGEITKPWWWPPNTFGWKEGYGCRHTEPDHILKPERLLLAVWLLRLFSLEHLKQSTKDIGASFDSEKRDHALERLENIYAARRSEEAYENGERDYDSGVCLEVSTPKNRLNVPIRHPEVLRFVWNSGVIRQVSTSGDLLPMPPIDFSKTLKPFIGWLINLEKPTIALSENNQLGPNSLPTPRRQKMAFNQRRKHTSYSNAVVEGITVPGTPPPSYELYGSDGRYAGSSTGAYPPFGVSHLQRASPLSSDSLNLIFNSTRSYLATSKGEEVMPEASGPFGNSVFGQSAKFDGCSSYSQLKQEPALLEAQTSWSEKTADNRVENPISHSYQLDPEVGLLDGQTFWPDNGLLDNSEPCSHGAQGPEASFCEYPFWNFSTSDTRDDSEFPSRTIHPENYLDYDTGEQPLPSGRLDNFSSMPLDFHGLSYLN